MNRNVYFLVFEISSLKTIEFLAEVIRRTVLFRGIVLKRIPTNTRSVWWTTPLPTVRAPELLCEHVSWFRFAQIAMSGYLPSQAGHE
jgi:hypothetical protein